MAINTEFQDPLDDIDPIMKEAFTGNDLSANIKDDSELEKDLDSIFDEITEDSTNKTNENDSFDSLDLETEDNEESIDWEPVVESEPIVATEPIVEPEPIVAPEPIVEPEPILPPEPIVEPEPILPPEPIAEPEPILPPEPIAEPEPILEQPSVHIPNIANIDFPELENESISSNLLSPELFQNIPVEISVELGRSSLSLKDIYELTEGSIIELQRLTGETLDLVVNGQIIAKGEVVTIDNKYGLRINELLSQNPKI